MNIIKKIIVITASVIIGIFLAAGVMQIAANSAHNNFQNIICR